MTMTRSTSNNSNKNGKTASTLAVAVLNPRQWYSWMVISLFVATIVPYWCGRRLQHLACRDWFLGHRRHRHRPCVPLLHADSPRNCHVPTRTTMTQHVATGNAASVMQQQQASLSYQAEALVHPTLLSHFNPQRVAIWVLPPLPVQTLSPHPVTTTTTTGSTSTTRTPSSSTSFSPSAGWCHGCDTKEEDTQRLFAIIDQILKHETVQEIVVMYLLYDRNDQAVCQNDFDSVYGGWGEKEEEEQQQKKKENNNHNENPRVTVQCIHNTQRWLLEHVTAAAATTTTTPAKDHFQDEEEVKKKKKDHQQQYKNNNFEMFDVIFLAESSARMPTNISSSFPQEAVVEEEEQHVVRYVYTLDPSKELMRKTIHTRVSSHDRGQPLLLFAHTVFVVLVCVCSILDEWGPGGGGY